MSLSDLGSGGISEPQRGPTVAVGIIGARPRASISVLPRRLPLGCRLWLYFRGPERADSRWLNHVDAWISGISVLPRRLALGSRLWRYLRPPEKADSGRRNHVAAWISAQPATPSISRSDGLTVKSVSQLVSRSVSQYLWSGQVRSVRYTFSQCHYISSVS